MRTFYAVILSLSVSVIIFMAGYRIGRRAVTPVAPDTIYVTDTAWLQPPAVVKEIPVPVPANVDTAAILASYHTKRIYQDDIVNTPYVRVTLTDTVYRNTIVGRSAISSLRIPVYNHGLSLGLTSGYRRLDLMVGYRNKRWEFMGGYDFYNKSPLLGIRYELSRW